MDSHPDGRPRTALLAGLTVLVLVAGGWWWTAADPHADSAAGAAALVPHPGTTRSGPFVSLDAELAAAAQRSRSDVGDVVDPVTGLGQVAVVDPATGEMTIHVRPDGSVQRGSFWVDPPRLGTVLWRETRVLTDNVRELRRQSAGTAGARHRLLVLCTGPGELHIRVRNGRLGLHQQEVRCDGALRSAAVTATGGPLTVRISHPQPGAVELTAIFLALD